MKGTRSPLKSERNCINLCFDTFSYGENKVNLRGAKSICELLSEPFEDTCV
jgi:Ca2+-transporting ATPase